METQSKHPTKLELPKILSLSKLSADIDRMSKLWAIPIRAGMIYLSFLALCLDFFMGPEMITALHRSRLLHGITTMLRLPKERCKIFTVYLLIKTHLLKTNYVINPHFKVQLQNKTEIKSDKHIIESS